MTSDTNFATALHTLGFIEAISHFSGNPASRKELSLEDYVGKITTLFSPYIPKNISEREFNSIQVEIKRILSEIKRGLVS